MDRLLTTRELADRLGLSPATVLRRWRAGELPGYRLASNVLRFDPLEVEQYLAVRRQGPSRCLTVAGDSDTVNVTGSDDKGE